jgi:hypothetical protein
MGDVSRCDAVRAVVAIGACAATVGVAACGNSTTTITPSPSGVATTPSGGGATTHSSSIGATPTSNVVAAAIALTLTDLPPGSPGLNQISDGLMNNQPNTDQRGFANAANTYRIEDDVLIDTSTQSATADYPQLRDATRAQVNSLSLSSTLTGLGSQADEYVGTTATGYSDVGITFQQGDVIAVLLLENAAGNVDPAFAIACARAQDAKIVAAGV